MTAASALLQYVISGATVGSTYGLTALGFTVIFNATEIINFAQGEFVMLGGMLAVFALRWGGVPLPLAVPLSVLCVTFIGVLVDRLTIRPVRGQSTLTLIIITIGVSILLRGGAMLLFGKDTYTPSEYPYYWRVFETRDEYFDYYRDYHAFWKLYGMDLPDDVLRAIYYENAMRIIPRMPTAGFPSR